MRSDAVEEAKRLAHTYFVNGYKAQMRGKYQDALRHFRRSLDAFPTAEAYTFMGWTLSLLSRYEEAIDCCKKAVEVDPGFGNPYNDIGAYLIETGRAVEAVPWLRRALSSERYDTPQFAHYNLGRAREILGDPIEAEQCYRKALEVNSRYVLARQALRRLEARRN